MTREQPNSYGKSRKVSGYNVDVLRTRRGPDLSISVPLLRSLEYQDRAPSSSQDRALSRDNRAATARWRPTHCMNQTTAVL